MELNIPDPQSYDIGESLGITLARQNEISGCLNAMVRGWQHGSILRLPYILQDIAGFCDTTEELVYAVMLHMGWWQRQGHNIAPR